MRFILAFLCAFSVAALLAQTRQEIQLGTSANDGTGDSLRGAFIKVSNNESNLFKLVLTNSSILDASFVVEDVAALVALDPANKANVRTLGYYTAGDGGGATYWWAAGYSGTTNAYGGALAVSGGAWVQVGDEANVKQFGATGLGASDDSERIQAALSFSSFATIRFTSGSYLVTNALEATRPLEIRFDRGAEISLAASGVDYASITPTGGNNHPAILNITSGNVEVHEFTISGGTNQIAAIKAGDDNYTSGSYITNVTIIGGTFTSIGATASNADTVTLARVRGGGISGATFTDCRGKSASLLGCIGSFIKDCQMTGCEQSLYVGEISPGKEVSQACVVTGNVAIDSSQVGLKLSRSSLGTTVAHNTWKQVSVFPSFYVVGLSSSQDSMFQNNLIWVQDQDNPSDEVVRIEPNTGAMKDSIRVTIADNVIVVTNSAVYALVYARSFPGYTINQPRLLNNSFINLGPTNQPLAVSMLTATTNEYISEPWIVGNYFEGFDLAIAIQETGGSPLPSRPLIAGNTYSNVTSTAFLEVEDPQSLLVGDFQTSQVGTNAVWLRAPESYGTDKSGPLLNIIGGRSTGSGAGGNILHWIYGTGSSGTNVNTAARVGSWHSSGLAIGDINPSASFGLEVVGNSARFADTSANNTTKQYRFLTRAYTDGNPSPIHSYIVASSSDTGLFLGGGTSAGAAVKNGYLFAAADNTTATGTQIARWSTSGVDIVSGNLTVASVPVALRPSVEVLTYSGSDVIVTAGKGPIQSSRLVCTNDFTLSFASLADGDSGTIHVQPDSSDRTVTLASYAYSPTGATFTIAAGSTNFTVIAWENRVWDSTNRVAVNASNYYR